MITQTTIYTCVRCGRGAKVKVDVDAMAILNSAPKIPNGWGIVMTNGSPDVICSDCKQGAHK